VFKLYTVNTVIHALFLRGDDGNVEDLLLAVVDAGVRKFALCNFVGPLEL
jgi:hypothetical protein